MIKAAFIALDRDDLTMLKRILLLLGETKSSLCARRYAIRLAQIKKASIVGLGGVDLTYLDDPMLGGIGTASLQADIEQDFKAQAYNARNRLHEAFERECRDQQLAFEWISFDGDPIETLEVASETSDLIVTGHDTSFRGNVREQLSQTIDSLLQETPRPVIVCPDEPVETEDVLIAYDGSVPALRALQLFTLLGVGTARSILVASIDGSREVAERRANAAVRFLEGHGYPSKAHPIESSRSPAEILNEEIAKRKIGTLVMGSFGHRGLREFFFGSTTSELVEQPLCPIFIYH
jgi:nucleotide-binding universal stress UspA family protein